MLQDFLRAPFLFPRVAAFLRRDAGLRAAVVVAVLGTAACAHQGYFLEESTGRIYTRDAFGRIAKWYEPGTAEHDAIALRFWPGNVEKPKQPERPEPGPRGRMAAFMRGLDKDQWHILLDMDLWTGDDRIDLVHLDDMQIVARAVKDLPFNDYLELKRRYPIRSELRAHLMRGER